MSTSEQNFNLEVKGMKAVCPLGEVVGAQMIAEERTPVISCEGGWSQAGLIFPLSRVRAPSSQPRLPGNSVGQSAALTKRKSLVRTQFRHPNITAVAQ